jgi:hypothetical protein
MPETPDDRTAIDVCAALLEQGRALEGLSRLLTLAALVLLFAGAFGFVAKPVAIPVGLIVIALGLVQTRFAIRVGFDAALLRDVAHRIQFAVLDQALVRLDLMPPDKAGRPLDARLAGAMRLLRLQGLALGAQLGVLVLGALVAAILQGRA